jgi:RNA polymerase sigma-70 factor (ECF subfamily)
MGTPLQLAPEREAALLTGLRAASESEKQRAVRAVLEHFHAPVFRLCLHLTGNRADAEDALQETLLALHRALPGFRAESQLSTWVYRITLRVALHVRARQPRDTSPLEEEAQALRFPDGSVPPDRLAAARQESTRLLQAMSRLSAEHRAVLSLFALEGLSHAQIASVLGIPEGTVWSRLHLARKKLMAAMEGAGGSPGLPTTGSPARER